jgi:hypothetical protein
MQIIILAPEFLSIFYQGHMNNRFLVKQFGSVSDHSSTIDREVAVAG